MPGKGRRALPQEVHDARGVKPTSGDTVRLVEPIAGAPVRPPQIKLKTEKDLWDKKVDDLTKRGVMVKGCEEQLAVYVCELVKYWKDFRAGVATAAQQNNLRLLAGDFYDTPATQYGKVKSKDAPKGSRFRDDGKPPPPPRVVRGGDDTVR